MGILKEYNDAVIERRYIQQQLRYSDKELDELESTFKFLREDATKNATQNKYSELLAKHKVLLAKLFAVEAKVFSIKNNPEFPLKMS